MERIIPPCAAAFPQGMIMTDDTASQRPLSDLDDDALFYHRHPKPGKLEIQATKALGNQRDLALAYSRGVAAPCPSWTVLAEHAGNASS